MSLSDSSDNSPVLIDLYNTISTKEKPYLLTIFSITLNMTYYTVKLTQKEIEYIHNIILNDHILLNNIDNCIKSILSDGKIDLHDIPKIILLLTEIYKSNCIEKLVKDVGIINIIRFTLESIIDYNYLLLPYVEKSVIKNIIDTSLNLLEISIESNKTKNRWLRYLCFLYK